MAGLLDIPRELYLSICTYLEQPELLGLSAVSRFAYIATQSPLYQNVRVSTYPGLIKLTRTLNERPVVTFHTPRYRSIHSSPRWQSGGKNSAMTADPLLSDRITTLIHANEPSSVSTLATSRITSTRRTRSTSTILLSSSRP